MECALGWPEGLRLLSRAGYPFVRAMQLAVFRHDVDSAKQMLSADCPMFNDKPSSRPPFRIFRPPINMLEATLCAHCQEVPIQICCVPQRRRFCCVLSYGPLEADSGARSTSRGF
jgi:hypothetical protein